MRARHVLPLAPVAAGALALAYGSGIELRAFTLRTAVAPVLPAGAQPLRVLHLSDLHLGPWQSRKARWVRSLDRLEPDLVINTGDNICHPDSVPPLLDALEPLLARPGAFVLGSNDRYSPRPRNPALYLLPDSGTRTFGTELPWQDVVTGFTAAGWSDLTNARSRLQVGGLDVAVSGIDDPHIYRDRYDEVAGPVRADLAIGVTHSPEPRVLDRFAGDGYRMLFAGHTHGGQVRIPFWGPPVTNCGIDRDRARGLSRWGDAWLHVSAGLGTSPYQPFRIACPPEATLLTLLPVG